MRSQAMPSAPASVEAARMASLAALMGGEPTLEAIERHYLGHLLDKYDGNRRKVADVLGVSERTAYRMLDRYGLK